MPEKKARRKAQEEKSPKLRAVVGLGASAGGLASFQSLLSALPKQTGLSYVLVQHMMPDRPSHLDELLAHSTALPICQAKDGTLMKPDEVYIIPPGHYMRFEDGRLRLEKIDGRIHRPINVFFSSLAKELQTRAIGVLLSGTGQDGVSGLLDIKTEGGVTLAEDSGAAHPSLPSQAVSAGAVDKVLSCEEIAKELTQLGSHPLLGAAADEELPPELLAKIFSLVSQQMGVDFSQYKASTVRRRLLRRMLMDKCQDLAGYYELLRNSSAAVEALYQDLLITVTMLFRDPEVYEALKSRVFPALVQGRDFSQSIRIWVAGCSRGDEVYSIAISLIEFLRENNLPLNVQFFATDVNEAALERARQGQFPESLAQEISPERLEQFFKRNEDGYQISKLVRDMCVFARQDLTRDPPFSRLDLISCRNVLIYLTPSLQNRILRIFHYALNRDGFLMLGGSESIGRASEIFTEFERSLRIFCRRAVPDPVVLETFEGASRPAVPEVARVVAPPPPAAAAAFPGLAEIQKEADRLVMHRYAPPGVLVNNDLEVMQFRGRTGLFLEHPAGSATLNLLKLAREGLLADLRLALQEAKTSGLPVQRREVRVRSNGDWTLVNLEVYPFVPASAGRERYYLVLFRSTEPDSNGEPRPIPNADAEAEIEHLRHELAATREYLNSINYEQEMTLENLQAANEEIQSSNEELQSTNEELETAKEELHSTNEELTTVNEELHERNRELTRVNNDLTNLLSSVNIPVLILGPDLRIRRFTPISRKILKLIPSDVGRPLGDLRPELEIPDLERRIHEVLDNLIPQQLELQDRNGVWYSVRIRPYRTGENHIDGVVILFVDIDQLKRSLDEAQVCRSILALSLLANPKPVFVLDSEMRISEANPAFLQLLGLKGTQVVGQKLASLDGAKWKFKGLMEALDEVEPGGQSWWTDNRAGWKMQIRRAATELGGLYLISVAES